MHDVEREAGRRCPLGVRRKTGRYLDTPLQIIPVISANELLTLSTRRTAYLSFFLSLSLFLYC